MTNRPTRPGLQIAAKFLIAVIVLLCAEAVRAQEQPRPVEVFVGRTTTVELAGATRAIVLNDTMCSARAESGSVIFSGIHRGDTVAFVWSGEERITFSVRVADPPPAGPPPRLARPGEGFFTGLLNSTAQVSMGTGAEAMVGLGHNMFWREDIDHTIWTAQGQFVQDMSGTGRKLNVQTATMQYSNAHRTITLLDFTTQFNIRRSSFMPYSPLNGTTLRGADGIFRNGRNTYEFFGGVTVPNYYLSLSGTSQAAGFSFERRQNDKVTLMAGTGYINVLPSLLAASPRTESFYQTAGLLWEPTKNWSLQGIGGISSQGAMGQAAAGYRNELRSVQALVMTSARKFPLLQLAGPGSGGTWIFVNYEERLSPTLMAGVGLQRTVQSPFNLLSRDNSNLSFGPQLRWYVSTHHSVSADLNYVRSEGGLEPGATTGLRFNFGLQSRFSGTTSNALQFAMSGMRDPLGQNTQAEWQIRDNLLMQYKKHPVYLNFSHSHTDPSLTRRLWQQINLLTPYLQSVFESDPVGFTQNLPPEVRALLSSAQPTSTQFGIATDLSIGTKLSFSPYFNYLRTSDIASNQNSPQFGYRLDYEIRPTLSLRTSMTSAWVFEPEPAGYRRTTVMAFGIQKRFSGVGKAFWLPSRMTHRSVEGRVFRDNNVNGVPNLGEPGIGGVRVEIEGHGATITGPDGRFKFDDLAPGEYRIILPLNQFKEPVRATNASDMLVNVFADKRAEVSFGILNFARVLGSIYNDYRMDGRRMPDAGGIRDTRLVLNGPARYEFTTDSNGDFELDDVLPGDYEMSVDRGSLPPNYMLANDEQVRVHVEPVSTIMQEIAVRANRSVAGRVLIKVVKNEGNGRITNGMKISGVDEAPANSPRKTRSGKKTELQAGRTAPLQAGTEESVLVPLSGAKISAAGVVATTDAEGRFVLRNLPAGDVMVRMVGIGAVPPEVQLPSGKLAMPMGPVQVNNARIVITNPDLVKYLVPSPEIPPQH